MEMSQILSKGEQARQSKEEPTSDATDLDSFLKDYEEPKVSAELAVTATDQRRARMIRKRFREALGIFGLVALIGGVIILVRARSRNQ